jgi:uncharacterized protein (DUF433 family)
MDTSTKLEAADLKLAAQFTCTTTPGAIKLDAYPLLVHSPMQASHNHPAFKAQYDPLVHGALIRTEDRGVSVADIVVKAAEMPDTEALAKHFGTTSAHVRQAIDYAVATSAPASEAIK